MPRLRGSDVAQRQSPRVPIHLRTSSSDSDPLHHRPTTDRSPKIGFDRRSPRGTQSDPPLNQKKLGTRIADLESQLGQAQQELKSLKQQLASAEAAKKAAQEQLEKKAKKPKVPERVAVRGKRSPPNETQEPNKNDGVTTSCENSNENLHETDVFEVPVEKVTMEPKVEHKQAIDQDEAEPKAVSVKSTASEEPEKPSPDEQAPKNDEINLLTARLEEKEKELLVFYKENESLKIQINEKSEEVSAARVKEGKMAMELDQVQQELETCRSDAIEMKQKLEATEKAKAALENEMKKLRVQTEQWRKAADAAAAVLAGGGVEMNGRRLSERCGSMDNQYGSVFEAPVGGYVGFTGSPGMADDSDDVYGSGKRRGSGIRMFGDLWKKKGHK